MLKKQNSTRKIPTNRVFWFWHFWVGLLLGPLAIVLVATGAIYVFKDGLETVMYPHLIYEAESNWRQASPDDVSATVQSVLQDYPHYRLYGLELETGTDRAPIVGHQAIRWGLVFSSIVFPTLGVIFLIVLLGLAIRAQVPGRKLQLNSVVE